MRVLCFPFPACRRVASPAALRSGGDGGRRADERGAAVEVEADEWARLFFLEKWAQCLTGINLLPLWSGPNEPWNVIRLFEAHKEPVNSVGRRNASWARFKHQALHLPIFKIRAAALNRRSSFPFLLYVASPPLSLIVARCRCGVQGRGRKLGGGIGSGWERLAKAGGGVGQPGGG